MAAPQSPPRSPSPPLSGQARVSHDQIEYSEPFMNGLMERLLRPGGSTKHSGIAVAAKSTNSSGSSVALADIDWSSLPDLKVGDLPLALDDPQRIYNSALPSVKLTHPGGWLEGGPGPEDSEQLVRDFMQQRNFRTQASLQKFLRDETRRQVAELKLRMQARQEAIEQNEKVEKEIQQLEAQRETERKLENRMLQDSKNKRGNG